MSIDIHDYLDPIDYTVDTSKLADEQAEAYYKDPKCEIVNSRIPHTVNKNTTVQFTASPESRSLSSEQDRKIHAEVLEWNQELPPLLTDCCVSSISKNYEKYPLLEQLACDNRTYLLEILPTSLPLPLVVPLIDYEHYWERRYEEEFGIVTYARRDDWNWKRLYLERYARKLMEEAQPQYSDETQMEDTLTLLQPYVQTLTVAQMQTWYPPLTMEPDEIPDVYPDDHIDFLPVFKKLTRIDEFDLVFGMDNVGEDFEWRMFKLSVDDCARLGRAVLELKFLRILRVHRSRLHDSHCQAILKGLVKNDTLVELDLSHCRIGDLGALCIAKLLKVHRTLEVLILADNQIGGVGGEGIGYALQLPDSSPVALLDLRLNPLGHQGAMGLFRSLARSTKPERVNLASCAFEDTTSYIFGFLLKVNRSLAWIDVSNNWFGEYAGESLVAGLTGNETVKWLDVRETYITPAQAASIKNLLKRNNNEEIGAGSSEEEIEILEEEVPVVKSPVSSVAESEEPGKEQIVDK